MDNSNGSDVLDRGDGTQPERGGPGASGDGGNKRPGVRGSGRKAVTSTGNGKGAAKARANPGKEAAPVKVRPEVDLAPVDDWFVQLSQERQNNEQELSFLAALASKAKAYRSMLMSGPDGFA